MRTWDNEPFEFAAILTKMNSETILEIFPNCYTIYDVFINYKYIEAVEIFRKWKEC
jgi:hypothetical protein